ncbi:MAG: prepilin-type N-terminal cleavage/methylation domain-containing protein [Lachnospiraceae bacterium]|nr:prepilin-type N-terminal cleavage/methylation domain-containing protein [Lachnospiraceae bacterium]
MVEKFRRGRKDNRGFTLVEMVVVMVIIAILATLMIGALNGYIDKAKEKTAVANCRSVVVAAQTQLSEEYAKGHAYSGTTWDRTSGSEYTMKKVLELADLVGKVTVVSQSVSDGTVNSMDVKTGDITARYTDDGGIVILN